MNFWNIPFAGLQSLQNTLINDWIGPVFFIALAVGAIYFVVNREFRKLAVFAGIAVVVALFIFFGNEIFGPGQGGLTDVGRGVISEVNAVNPYLPFLW